MERSETDNYQTHENPREPIIVLGKQNDYLFIGSTVERTVAITRTYLPIGGGGRSPDTNRLRLEDLEFFDIAGRPLEAVVKANELEDLVVRAAENHQEKIRARIRTIAQEIERIIRVAREGDPAFGQPPLVLPDENVSFEEFIRKLASENRQLTDEDRFRNPTSDCPWFQYIMGNC